MRQQHLRFAQEYLARDGERGAGLEAARAAGYKGNDKSLTERASKLLARDDVKAYIIAAQAKATIRAEVDAEWIVERLKAEATVSETTTPASRVRSLELLAKRLPGFFAPARTELSGPDGGPVKYESMSDTELEDTIRAKARALGITLTP